MTPNQAQSLCPEAAARDAMSDAEFWEHVLLSLTDNPRYDQDAYLPDPDDPVFTVVPCPVCGTHAGACGYDQEGRAMVHATSDEVDAQ